MLCSNIVGGDVCGYGITGSGSWFNDGSYVGDINDKDFIELSEEDANARLLTYVKEKYPIGTRFRSVCFPSSIREVTTAESHEVTSEGILINYSNYVFYKGKWAEVVEPVLTTVDKVKIYTGDDLWGLHVNNSYHKWNWDSYYVPEASDPTSIWFKDVKFFSTEKALKDHVNKGSAMDIADLLADLKDITYSITGDLIRDKIKELKSKLI